MKPMVIKWLVKRSAGFKLLTTKRLEIVNSKGLRLCFLFRFSKYIGENRLRNGQAKFYQ
jgi:hypothetical protein